MIFLLAVSKMFVTKITKMVMKKIELALKFKLLVFSKQTSTITLFLNEQSIGKKEVIIDIIYQKLFCLTRQSLLNLFRYCNVIYDLGASCEIYLRAYASVSKPALPRSLIRVFVVC